MGAVCSKKCKKNQKFIFSRARSFQLWKLQIFLKLDSAKRGALTDSYSSVLFLNISWDTYWTWEMTKSSGNQSLHELRKSYMKARKNKVSVNFTTRLRILVGFTNFQYWRHEICSKIIMKKKKHFYGYDWELTVWSYK